jgi:hypothetical protein
MTNFGFMGIQNNSIVVTSTTNNTNPGDNRTSILPYRVNHTVGGNTIRGRMRGLWCYGHAIATVSDMDTITGLNEYAGKTFLILKSSQGGAVHCLETSNTWDTN